MKIGIDCRMYRSGVAGIGRYSQNLIKNILEIDQEDEFVLFMTQEDEKEFENLKIKNSIKIDNLKFKIIITDIVHYSLAEQTKFLKIIAAEKLDLMHFLNFNFPIRYRGKFVVTIHDLTLYFYPATARQTNVVKRTAFNFVMKNACNKADKIIADSKSTKNDIIKVFKTPAEKIEVIYFAADDKEFQTVNKDFINKLENKYNLNDSPIILTVGQFRPHKNLPGLVEAFDILRKDIDAKLVILGKPDPKHARLSYAIDNSPYKRDIIIPGFVSDKELAAWYKIAAVYCFPSLYEGFGLPGLEAMAAGLPVVSSNTSSLPEVYDNAALYFDPLKSQEIAGTIKEVINNNKLRQELISKGYAQVKKYSWQKTASETLKIYNKIVQQ